MQLMTYFSASILSFSGLIIGITLIKIAPEEQNQLKKYFVLIRKILLLTIFAFVIFYYFNDRFYLLTLIAYLVFIILTEFVIKDLFKRSIITYALFGILFFLSSINKNLFAIESSLILLYGVPTASLMYNRKEKSFRNKVSGELKNQGFLSNHYKIIFYNLGFLIIANLLYFI